VPYYCIIMRLSATATETSTVTLLFLLFGAAILLVAVEEEHILTVGVVGVGAYSVAGKTALVTGSAGGIGKGIAKALADKGAKIIVHYHTRETEARAFSKELGPERCLGVVHCDFRNISSIPSFFGRVRDLCRSAAAEEDDDSGSGASTFYASKLDILVNNAGAITKLALEDDDENLTVWQNTMAVNLHAPNLLGKLFAGQFREGNEDDDSCTATNESDNNNNSNNRNVDGVILNVGSIHGDRSNEYMGAYAASKAALESLTRTQAIEYGRIGSNNNSINNSSNTIRVNLIAPGIVPVERTEQFFRENPQVLESWTDRIPLGRAGTVEQVAAASLAMIENEWVTGAVWQIDGGMMARGNMPQRDRP